MIDHILEEHQTDLQQVEELRLRVLKQRDNYLADKHFSCGSCQTPHRIKDINLLDEETYIQPSGCSDGDYWVHLEYKFICTQCQGENRLLFNNYDLNFENRRNPELNLERIFMLYYARLFKSIEIVRKEPSRSFLFKPRKRNFANLNLGMKEVASYVPRIALEKRRLKVIPQKINSQIEQSTVTETFPISQDRKTQNQVAAILLLREARKIEEVQEIPLGVERDEDGYVQICIGCGSVATIEALQSQPGVRSCCPERKMVRATHAWQYSQGSGLLKKESCSNCDGKGWV